MCSFWQRMDNDQGDLSDIVRASGGGPEPTFEWHFPTNSTSFPAISEDFGDPFSVFRHPEINFPSNSSATMTKPSIGGEREREPMLNEAGLMVGEEMRPCELLSRMLQISTPKSKASPVCGLINSSSSSSTSCSTSSSSVSPRIVKTPIVGASDNSVKTQLVVGSVGCQSESNGLQISSPRNSGIKRRKSQTKKVVCIPAPSAATNRQSGEVVPSDLWAWRKYGQKPIKGSPYPRGYYRCSSSKGCSARKQVERSRNDPNMLVITYTSEHNHPWPTQRNALAGSTRSQPMKANSLKNSPSTQQNPNLNSALSIKQETKDTDNSTITNTRSSDNYNNNDVDSSISIKDDIMGAEREVIMEDRGFNPGFPVYRPVPTDQNHSDDFFADLGELEPDPLNLMFNQGFNEDKSDEDGENKEVEPFSLFDWSENSFGDSRRGL
ncbi:hypothetical protein AMTRI_Chr02g255090 [Amborella trichopoda]